MISPPPHKRVIPKMVGPYIHPYTIPFWLLSLRPLPFLVKVWGYGRAGWLQLLPRKRFPSLVSRWQLPSPIYRVLSLFQHFPAPGSPYTQPTQYRPRSLPSSSHRQSKGSSPRQRAASILFLCIHPSIHAYIYWKINFAINLENPNGISFTPTGWQKQTSLTILNLGEDAEQGNSNTLLAGVQICQTTKERHFVSSSKSEYAHDLQHTAWGGKQIVYQWQ